MRNIDSIIWKHNGILKETIAQKENYPNEPDYINAIIKRMTCINLAQRFKLKQITT